MPPHRDEQSQTESVSVSPIQFEPVMDVLKDAIARLHTGAWRTFAVAGLALLVALPALYLVSSHAVTVVVDNKNSVTVFVFELLRTTAFAGVITAGIWGLFNLGKAQLDQATRYEKRLIAAHFLNYTLSTYEAEIREGDIKLPEVMSFLKSWSENVESAFTKLKFGKKPTDDFAMVVTKSGVGLAHGSAKVPEVPE